MSSDGPPTVRVTVPEGAVCSNSPLADVRPRKDEDTVSTPFGGHGRPSNEEQERRETEFKRLLVTGAALDEAARRSQLHPMRALRLLSPREMRQLAAECAA